MATSYETVEQGGESSVEEGLQFRLEAIDSLRTVVEGLTGSKGNTANKAAPPLLAPKDAAPEGAEKEKGGFCATLGSVIVPLLTVGGALAASVLLTLIPFQGVCISFGMQVLGISIDKVRHGRGQTVFWPKVLHVSLCPTYPPPRLVVLRHGHTPRASTTCYTTTDIATPLLFCIPPLILHSALILCIPPPSLTRAQGHVAARVLVRARHSAPRAPARGCGHCARVRCVDCARGGGADIRSLRAILAAVCAQSAPHRNYIFELAIP